MIGYDSETNSRAPGRERPGKGAEVLHRSPRLREASGLPTAGKAPLAYGRAEGAGTRIHPRPRQVQDRISPTTGSWNRRHPLGVHHRRLSRRLRATQGARRELQGWNLRRASEADMGTSAYFKDPDGNQFALIQPKAKERGV